MDRSKRIEAFILLGKVFKALSQQEMKGVESIISIDLVEEWNEAIEKAQILNPWFTKDNVILALEGLGEMLEEDKILEWISIYISELQELEPLNIGVIMAGNIPLVGFHDMLCVLISGHVFHGKMSSEDRLFYPLIKKTFLAWDQGWDELVHLYEDKLASFDAIIATGSNNTAKHFEYYFGKYPNIIRKNRNAIAIFSGDETKEDIREFGKDLFQFFGLGCRNVSKLFLPQGFELNRIFEGIYEYGEVINHHKWCNNYDYNKAVFLMSSFKFLDNNFLLLKEQEGNLISPLGTLYYEFYEDRNEVIESLEQRKDEIQCIVGRDFIPFGRSQKPELWDYADGVDTMKFLSKLHSTNS
ncbi:MAG: acyl-CoA reductase [Bacteroidota bacterium]